MQENSIKEFQKTVQKEFRIEKLIERKGNKFYVNWKGFNNSFNSWIDKKDSTNEWISSKTKSLGANVKAELDLSSYAIWKCKRSWNIRFLSL